MTSEAARELPPRRRRALNAFRKYAPRLPLSRWWLIAACSLPIWAVVLLAAKTGTLTEGASCTPLAVARLIGHKKSQPNVCREAVLAADLPSIALAISSCCLLYLHVWNSRAVKELYSELFRDPEIARSAISFRARMVHWILSSPFTAGLAVMLYWLVQRNKNLFTDLVQHQLKPADGSAFNKVQMSDSWWANIHHNHGINTLVWAAVGAVPATLGLVDQTRIARLAGKLRKDMTDLRLDRRAVWDDEHLGTASVDRLVESKVWGGFLLIVSLYIMFYLVRTPTNVLSVTNGVALPVLAFMGYRWWKQYRQLRSLDQDLKLEVVRRAREKYRRSLRSVQDMIVNREADSGDTGMPRSRWLKNYRKSHDADHSAQPTRGGTEKAILLSMMEIEAARIEAEQAYLMFTRPRESRAREFGKVTVLLLTLGAAFYGIIPNLFH
ncbi:MAG: hypothetical protein ACJ74U_10220 [Jatrophihabitantaceae bacterium]